MAERSKAPDSSNPCAETAYECSGLHLEAWVRIPLLTKFLTPREHVRTVHCELIWNLFLKRGKVLWLISSTHVNHHSYLACSVIYAISTYEKVFVTYWYHHRRAEVSYKLETVKVAYLRPLSPSWKRVAAIFTTSVIKESFLILPSIWLTGGKHTSVASRVSACCAIIIVRKHLDELHQRSWF